MSQLPKAVADPGSVSRWLVLAGSNGEKCFICSRIVEVNRPDAGEIRPIKISGIELSPDTQVTHLSLCVGRTAANA